MHFRSYIFFVLKNYTLSPGAIDRQQTVYGATHHPIYNKMCARKKRIFCFYSDNRDHFKSRSPLGRLVAVFLRADCCKELQKSKSVPFFNSIPDFISFAII